MSVRKGGSGAARMRGTLPALCSRASQALEQAAQGGGGVTVPGGVQTTCRCGTSGYGLVGTMVLGGWWDSNDLTGLFQPVIL